MVCGVGYERAAAAGPAATRYHDVRLVVSNLGVFDFETPDHAHAAPLGAPRGDSGRGA